MQKIWAAKQKDCLLIVDPATWHLVDFYSSHKYPFPFQIPPPSPLPPPSRLAGSRGAVLTHPGLVHSWEELVLTNVGRLGLPPEWDLAMEGAGEEKKAEGGSGEEGDVDEGCDVSMCNLLTSLTRIREGGGAACRREVSRKVPCI